MSKPSFVFSSTSGGPTTVISTPAWSWPYAAAVLAPAFLTFGVQFDHTRHGNDCEIQRCHVYAPPPMLYPTDAPERHYPAGGPLQALAYVSGASSTATIVFGGDV